MYRRYGVVGSQVGGRWRIVRMTVCQRRVLDFIEAFIARERFSPSFKEIATGVGLKSIGTVAKHIRQLKQQGRLIAVPGQVRSIEIVAHEARVRANCAKCESLDLENSELKRRCAYLAAQLEAAQRQIRTKPVFRGHDFA
jgi:SOS-response transcriptional repressor LexA